MTLLTELPMSATDQTTEITNAATHGSPATDSRLPATMLYRTPLELRWRDLDAFGHVNNATFLTYIEEARIRWFETIDGPWVNDQFAPLMAAVQMNYRKSIEYPAQLIVELSCERIGTTSLTLGHRIVADDDTNMLYADGHVVMVWIDRASGRPIALPAAVKQTGIL